jgi:DNA-3-methyladenine glycosylase
MINILDATFFNRDTNTVAQDLLGKYLVRQKGSSLISAMITQTEAYDGFYDKASHAFRGKTVRNQVMFGRPGFFYVYLCYGMHYMLNIVTREAGYPAAVLIRGIDQIDGPGRVTKSLDITKNLNAKPVVKSSRLWIEDRGILINPNNIEKTPRIGVSYAGPAWANKKWRYLLTTPSPK